MANSDEVILLALCKIAPDISGEKCARRLVAYLAKYLSCLHTIHFRPSPGLRRIRPSPLDVSTRAVSTALLTLALRFETLASIVKEACTTFLDNVAGAVMGLPALQAKADGEETCYDPQTLANIASITVCVSAFMEVAGTFSHVWTPTDRVAIIKLVRELLSDRFLLTVETAMSQLRTVGHTTRPLLAWKRYFNCFLSQGTPLGSVLLRRSLVIFVEKATSLQQPSNPLTGADSTLEAYIVALPTLRDDVEAHRPLVETSAEVIVEQMTSLETPAYYGSDAISQQCLVLSLKAFALVGFLNCLIQDEEYAHPELLLAWLEDTLSGCEQGGHTDMTSTALKCMVVLAEVSPPSASSINRSLLRILMQNGQIGSTANTAARCLAELLRSASQDMVIGTLYSLGNFLSSSSSHVDLSDPARLESIAAILFPSDRFNQQQLTEEEVSSFCTDSDVVTYAIYKNVVHAIVTIAASTRDPKVVALAQSVLLQKIGKTNTLIDTCILLESAQLALHNDFAEFEILLKLYSRMYRNALLGEDNLVLHAILRAKIYVSENISPTSPIYQPYLIHLLESIVNKGELGNNEKGPKNGDLTAEELIPLLIPLAVLFAHNSALHQSKIHDDQTSRLLRDVWFNLAVHGISFNSDIAKIYHRDLCALAVCSPPLIAENRYELLESDLELNAVLRRGINLPHSLEKKRRTLSNELPALESEIRRLNYPKLTFLNAALLIECLRSSSGDCAKVHVYFMDPALSAADMSGCMKAIVDKVVSIYLEKCLRSSSVRLTASHISSTLADIFIYCCHRVDTVRQISAASASKIVESCPFSLCNKRAISTLLDLLSVMWLSCIEEELDEYEWRPVMRAPRSSVEVELPDDYELRKRTLSNLTDLSFRWISSAMRAAPFGTKGLLQTYLAESEEEGACDRILLGRSVALELGCAAPSGERKSLQLQNTNVCKATMASEFIAQYTARQKYRFSNSYMQLAFEDALSLSDVDSSTLREQEVRNSCFSVLASLRNIESDLSHAKMVPFEKVRMQLKAATSLLCTSKCAAASLVSHVVYVPFIILTTEAIELGLSLWMSIINENPSLSTKLLASVVEAWELSIVRGRGIFDLDFKHVDPFLLKTEFAPSNKEELLRQQHKARDMISPHSRVLQFLLSQYNARRLSSPLIERVFIRMISRTMIALRQIKGHPLHREVYFDTILFALDLIKDCVSTSKQLLWRLKDLTLSAALSWFERPAWWSFGGNRIQLKAEEVILGTIDEHLLNLSWSGLPGTGVMQSLSSKRNLLRMLVAHERSRLRVWLNPLQQDRKGLTALSAAGLKVSGDAAASFVPLAWSQHPSLAIQLSVRFPSPKAKNDVRSLLLEHPEQAMEDPDSLDILLGPVLLPDVSDRLRYLLFWEPMNPASSMVYFMPAYGNHPFILQYAMRALDSHAVEVSFFYVPQLVQTLRYDALGYVERYIFQTAQLSQLFAHQVIWNMKANSFKDDDGQVPDAMKPVLDKFMDSLEAHFSEKDRNFYEREFSFFNEVTGISGKLKPYIKRSKAEKKAKIEEELKKIKVEVGVYLPSNPDGVVVGIDRKSGKPLQSHAKAPYMATFRIRKSKGQDETATDSQNAIESTGTNAQGTKVYDVWQSAIFKVGDDCRQDVLALQMIAAFRSIFASNGLDVFVYPYRVTATAPGCGVIDVLPNSISRDMLGREAVNGLYDYFVSKYGGAQSTRFQEARSNFVKSMAAYSVISYLLQFKDRHNGNIMIDDDGHILHIDFGFCFDIAPGGVKFERAPFKLTSEMVAVMGGLHPSSNAGPSSSSSGLGLTTSHDPTNSQAYRWFESLVVKAFLASRPYATKLSHIVALMLDSGLPCFKPDTLRNFRDRFVPEKNEREAAEYMQDLVRKSYLSRSTKEYDRFQLWTNKIPY
ncbi:phosphatidylinositol-4- kinase [Ascosphaera aggregata]|nr:phosphatidylinositol-4- kinase [Ascosphaera aggregata]